MKACPERSAALALLRKYNAEPFHIQHGLTVEGAVSQISLELLDKFSYALVWGTSTKYSPQHCGLAHILEDEDVLQIVKKTVNQEKHDKNYSQQCQAVYDKYKKKKKSAKSS